MVQVTLDNATTRKAIERLLADHGGAQLELRDSEGNVIAYLVPASGEKPVIDEDTDLVAELHRRLQSQQPTSTTAEVLARLNTLQPGQ